jgi:sugar diacid utilization regulator
MFTHGDESVLLSMIEKLIDLRVSGLAVKNIFFKDMPEKVINICNERGFPVVLFDNTVYFEEIITDIDNAIQISDWINQVETKIGLLHLKDLSRYEVEVISKEMRIAQQKYAVAFYMIPKILLRDFTMHQIIKSYRNHPFHNENVSFFKYQQGFVVLLASDNKVTSKNKDSFHDVLRLAGIQEKEYIIGVSLVHNPIFELDLCIKEAIWSEKVAGIMSVERKEFSELGTWSILLGNQHSRHMVEYMEHYLEPIVNIISDSNKELLKTAIAYIKCDGNTKTTADKLFIHENTVRYRINKIREKLDPNVNDFAFYENLSLAVKIYLSNNRVSK